METTAKIRFFLEWHKQYVLARTKKYPYLCRINHNSLAELNNML